MKIDTNHFNTLERMRDAQPTQRVDIAVDFVIRVLGDILKHTPHMTSNNVAKSFQGLKTSWGKLCAHELPVTDCGEYVLNEPMVAEVVTDAFLSQCQDGAEIDRVSELMMGTFTKLGWDPEHVKNWINEKSQ